MVMVNLEISRNSEIVRLGKLMEIITVLKMCHAIKNVLLFESKMSKKLFNNPYPVIINDMMLMCSNVVTNVRVSYSHCIRNAQHIV